MPPGHTRDWVDFLEALGPLLAVIAVLIVGFVQAYLQRKQVQQDLFDKRYKVYVAVDAFVTNVLNVDGAMDTDAVAKFRAETAHAEFLFGQDVIDFIGLVTGRAMELAIVKAQIQKHCNAVLEFQRGVPNPERPR